MRKLTTRYQMVGELNRQLNRIRAKMNQDIRDRYNDFLESKKVGSNGSQPI